MRNPMEHTMMELIATIHLSHELWFQSIPEAGNLRSTHDRPLCWSAIDPTTSKRMFRRTTAAPYVNKVEIISKSQLTQDPYK
jgi:hypothetical protein